MTAPVPRPVGVAVAAPPPTITIARAGALLVAGQAVALTVGLGVSVVLARELGPVGQGAYALGVLIVTLATLLVGQGVLAANVHFAGSGRVALRDLGGASAVVVLAGTAATWLVLGGLWITGALAAALPGVDDRVILVGALAIPVFLTRQLGAAILTGRQLIGWAAGVDVAQSVVLAAAVVVGLAVLGPSPDAALAAYAAAGVVGAGIVLWRLRSLDVGPSPHWRAAVLRTVVWFGLRSNLGTILQFVTYRLDFLLVNALVGTAVVGQYAVAARLTELLWVLPAAVGTAVFAARSRSGATSHATDETIRAFWGALAVTTVAGVALAALAPVAVPIVFTDAFAPSVPALLILVPGTVLLGCSAILANDLAGRDRPGLISGAALAAFVVTVLLDLVLIPAWGMLGAATASSISYSTYALAVGVAFLRVTGTPLRAFVAPAAHWRKAARLLRAARRGVPGPDPGDHTALEGAPS